METETIQVMGVTLRRPTQFQVSCASKSCTYLQNGFCVVCDCAACTGGFLIDEWKQRIRAGDAACGPRECACVQRARNRKHLRDSGLEKLVEKCTFDNFRTDTSWRKIVKDKALAYLKDCHSSSYYIGGQSGAGKTHICTAICGEIMRQGHKLRYFQWIKDGLRLKQIISEREVYEKELKTWAEVPLLYIDDLYKNEISDADIRLLYEILNARYNNELPTILSSERSLAEIGRARGGAGEALTGRIFEMCGSGRYCIEVEGKDKNTRFHPVAAAT